MLKRLKTIYKFLKKYSTGEISINVNDVFFYACADSEEVTFRDIGRVMKAENKYGEMGVYAWIAVKRKMEHGDKHNFDVLHGNDGQKAYFKIVRDVIEKDWETDYSTEFYRWKKRYDG